MEYAERLFVGFLRPQSNSVAAKNNEINKRLSLLSTHRHGRGGQRISDCGGIEECMKEAEMQASVYDKARPVILTQGCIRAASVEVRKTGKVLPLRHCQSGVRSL